MLLVANLAGFLEWIPEPADKCLEELRREWDLLRAAQSVRQMLQPLFQFGLVLDKNLFPNIRSKFVFYHVCHLVSNIFGRYPLPGYIYKSAWAVEMLSMRFVTEVKYKVLCS